MYAFRHFSLNALTLLRKQSKGPSSAARHALRLAVEVSGESMTGRHGRGWVFESGDITRIGADDRPRTVGGRVVPTRWSERFPITVRWTAVSLRLCAVASRLSAHFDEIFPADVGVEYKCGYKRRRLHPGEPD
jgi:hypothetical protein